MHTDALHLREFYGTPLGRVCQSFIGEHIQHIWPNVAGLTIAGIGYTAPYLERFLTTAARVMSLNPASQGVVYWPAEARGLSILCDEQGLPLDAMSVDRLMLVHCLETTEYLRPLLSEAWRVLRGNGRLIVVVPNRRSMWARVENTPFGHGSPYTLRQIKNTLREGQFVPEYAGTSLFIPPSSWGIFTNAARFWERAGHHLYGFFGGVHIVEASKQNYAAAAVRSSTMGYRLSVVGGQ